MNTVRMSAYALRSLMGENFDNDLYEQGRREARELFKKAPEARTEKLDEVKRILESGEYRHRPGPEYWIGCLCEFDFRW